VATNANSTSGGAGAVAPSPRRQTAVRRAPTSVRLAREARQRRLWYAALFAVIAVVVVTLVAGVLWQYVIQPAQSVATVNGVGIRNDVFGRYQNFENYLVQGQAAQIQQLASQPGASQLLTQEQQQIQQEQSNIPAYTLQQMEQSLEVQQAAAKIGAAPTPAQIDAEYASQRQQFDKARGAGSYDHLIGSLGVKPEDVKAYYIASAVVQTNVTKHFQGTAPMTQPWAQARHILVGTQAQAQLIAKAIKNGGNFAALAQKYSTDNGIQPGQALTGTARLQAEQQSSAFNGGWLRDPQPANPAQVIPVPTHKVQQKVGKTTKTVEVPNAPAYTVPTWLTPSTSYVKPVLDAVLSMKVGEMRVVQSQYGFHVIQVTAHETHTLSKQERATILQQQGQQGYQTWFTSATDATRNKVNPPDPYAQLPAPTAATGP